MYKFKKVLNLMRWTKEETIFITNNYNKYSLTELAKLLNKSKMSIANKASKMYLTSPKYDIYEYSLEELKNIASKYKSKIEFKKKNWRAYNFASVNKIINEICDYEKSYSIPQLILKEIMEGILKEKCEYNSRKIIPPYELDIYFEKWKLAFEYNGKGWHNDNKNDIIKIDLCEKK